MFEKSDLALPNWISYSIALLIFALPSLAVTVKSGATTVFLLVLIPSLILGWSGWSDLCREEKFLLMSFLIFVVLVGFSIINNSDPFENLSSYEKYLRFAAFVPIYLFVKKYAINLGPWLVWGVIVGCIVMGMVAIYQHHWLEIIRPHGARNIARFGIISVLFFLILVLILMFEWRKPKIFVIGVTSALFILYAIVLNHTRSAILSLIPFFIVMVVLNRNHISKKQGLVFFLLTICLAVLLLHPSSPVAQHFVRGFSGFMAFVADPFNNYVSDWGIRPHMYYTGLLVFLESPLIGTGLSDYASDVQGLMDSGKIHVSHYMLLTSPHNIYINSLAETGLLGFFGFLFAVCIAPIYCYSKIIRASVLSDKNKFYAFSGISVSVCFLFFGLFHTWTNINNSISIFLLLHLVFISNAFNTLSEGAKK